jgi:hypothetical protein
MADKTPEQKRIEELEAELKTEKGKTEDAVMRAANAEQRAAAKPGAPVLPAPKPLLYDKDGVTVTEAIGIRGGPFSVYGTNLPQGVAPVEGQSGPKPPSIVLGGQNAGKITAWSPIRIKGSLEQSAPLGKVKVQLAGITFDMTVVA